MRGTAGGRRLVGPAGAPPRPPRPTATPLSRDCCAAPPWARRRQARDHRVARARRPRRRGARTRQRPGRHMASCDVSRHVPLLCPADGTYIRTLVVSLSFLRYSGYIVSAPPCTASSGMAPSSSFRRRWGSAGGSATCPEGTPSNVTVHVPAVDWPRPGYYPAADSFDTYIGRSDRWDRPRGQSGSGCRRDANSASSEWPGRCAARDDAACPASCAWWSQPAHRSPTPVVNPSMRCGSSGPWCARPSIQMTCGLKSWKPPMTQATTEPVWYSSSRHMFRPPNPKGWYTGV